MGRYLEELEEDLLQSLEEASQKPNATEKDNQENAEGSGEQNRDKAEKENSER